MADEDQDQKTEDPTAKKLQEAFDKGNVPFSKELGSFLMLAFLALIVVWYAPGILRSTRNMLMRFISEPDGMEADFKGISLLLSEFSMRSAVEFIKNLIKVSIVSFVAYLAVYPQLAHVQQLPNGTADAMLIFIALLAAKLTLGVAIAMFFIALFDLVYQRLQYTKSLRMTKQEIKDEYKQSEGDPVIKQKLRQLRQEKAKQRMMAEVPKSDVVITNPTHFAVALTYNSTDMKAPTVVAKGQDLIALRIREIAEENGVPIVQNPPLARALFKSTDIDEEIPLDHYEAVAKVISYVYGLKGKKNK